MEYHFRVYKEEVGYSGQCIELEGVLSQGDTMEEFRFNLKEALDLALDEPANSDLIIPLPKKSIKGKNIIKIPVEPHIALAMLVRQERIKNKMTQAKVAAQMKVPLYSYQKLENSKTANPEWKTLVKLRRLFPKLNFNLAL